MTLKHSRTYLLLLIGFSLASLLPRFVAISANTLHSDDFMFFLHSTHPFATINQRGSCFPPQDYRWVYILILCVLGDALPTWSTSVVPKILAGLFLAAFSTLLYRVLILWFVPTVIALLTPLVFI